MDVTVRYAALIKALHLSVFMKWFAVPVGSRDFLGLDKPQDSVLSWLLSGASDGSRLMITLQKMNPYLIQSVSSGLALPSFALYPTILISALFFLTVDIFASFFIDSITPTVPYKVHYMHRPGAGC